MSAENSIDKFIEDRIEQSVEKIVNRILEPVAVLREFEGVEVLTLDEVCKILRCDSKEKIRDACKRGELPHLSVGRDLLFPKRLIAECLMGTWRGKQKETKRRTRSAKMPELSDKVRRFVS